ncbi:MAG TPA: FtsX-like permease family protein, partial [Bryobacteraceae bacterium]|nr:FtsX-like permease family protein [Bryobacteraceae bacterium]
AVNVPVMRDGRTPGQVVEFYREAARQIREVPGVLNVAVAGVVPWRDRNIFTLEFSPDGHVPAAGEASPRAVLHTVSPAFFATLGLPIIEGRDFNDADRDGSEPVAIVSQTLAERIFHGSALDHQVLFNDPILKFGLGIRPKPRRIIGIVPDIDNSNLVAKPTMTVYHPFDQEQLLGGGRLLVHARSDPYALVQPITTIIRKLSANQPVERAQTLADIRAQVLSPERLNVVVSGVFAGVALLIAVVGVAGVLAFSVSARTREFGIRLAVGSEPSDLLMRVIAEGAAMAIGGLALGLAGGYWLAQVAGSVLGGLKMPGVLPVAGAALVLLLAAVIASAIPALRAARVDVMQALRFE